MKQESGSGRIRQIARGLVVAMGVVVLLGLGSGHPQAAENESHPAASMSAQMLQSQCLNAGQARSSAFARSGKVRFLGTNPGQPIPQPARLPSSASAEQAARGYLTVCGSLFGVQDQARELAVERFKPLDRGRAMVRFQQVYQGVPVFGGEFIVHVDNAKNIVSVSGKALPGVAVTTRPTVDATTARRNALQSVAKKYQMNVDDLTATEPRLWVYNPMLLRPGNGFTSLVWRMDVTPKALAPVRELVLVEAQRGGIALSFNQVDTFKNRETYTTYNTLALPGFLVCNESTPCPVSDSHAVGAHTNAGLTYDFYSIYHGRDSINGAGMTMRSTVHYSSGYNNAYWNGNQVVYGDVKTYPLAADVVAHEFTHGVTDYESGLFYYYQSGAINESLSDVWGEFVDQVYGTGAINSWLIGQDLVPGGAMRSMWNPPTYGDPDKMTSGYYYLGTDDEGGVHTNSGVNNKAAYLMTVGGSFNGYTIAGLGMTKVLKIYYEVQTNLLISGSDYTDLYDALYQGCLNLVDTNGIVASDCQQVRNATLAVEMNQQPSPGYNAKAPLCAGGQTAVNTFFDNLEGGAGNWSFGAYSGTSRWQYDAPPTYGRFAHSGIHFLYANDAPAATSDSYAAMNTSVLVPANAYLHFAHAYGFEDPDYDGGVVEYSTNGGSTWNDAGSLFEYNGYDGTVRSVGTTNPLAGRSAFIGDSHGYISSRLNLSSLAGQSVRFRWRMGLDSIVYDWGWWLDDVRIYTCTGSSTSSNTYLPLLTKSEPASGWVTILSEDFEGYFPGPWTVSPTGGYTWGKRTCRPFSGTNSGWAVGGGASGALLGCMNNYPNNVASWMIYGPFSLVGATAAELRFKAWVNSTYPDRLSYFASTDGANFWGNYTTGSGGWTERVLDLSNVYTIGNLLGQPNVWISFRFLSDASTNYPEGVYLDNIVLRKCPVASCPATGSSTLNADNVRITERPDKAAFPK